MIRSLNDFTLQARERGPKRVAVLAPEDEDFMTAVKTGWSMGYIEPVLIGDIPRMERAAEKTAFDIGGFEKIPCAGPQAISDLGIGMLFGGQAPIASKGQIPTSYVYRSIIRGESAAASGMTVSVISFWEIPGVDHLVAFTDTGVNINPDARAKEEIIRNAVFVCRLLGYRRPKISALSGRRAVGGTLDSYRDYEALRRKADEGCFGECEFLAATSFSGLFGGAARGEDRFRGLAHADVPHIIVVPCLDTGNILIKLDFFLEVTRSSLVATSRGPVCIPSRSDYSDNIVQQLAMCVVLADEMEKEAVRHASHLQRHS